MHKLRDDRLNDFLKVLCRDRIVFAHEPLTDGYRMVRSEAWDSAQHTLGAYRPVEPLKALVFPPRELLGSIGEPAVTRHMPERIVIGVKNCDLSALRIHDHVFLKTEPVDPLYAQTRERTLLVSCDCTDARPVCFCPAVKEQPYAKKGFDVNLSPTSRGIVVEAGSERGENLLRDAAALLEPADEALLKERDALRAAVTRKVCEQTDALGLACGQDLQKAIQKTPDSELWDTFAEACVECGACNLVCCTCHCFLLADGSSKQNPHARTKLWDSCLYRNFARVAGGANPRKHRAERLQNRFDKKFNFFPQVLQTYACDGCGRCIEACTGKIDIREVLKKALHEL